MVAVAGAGAGAGPMWGPLERIFHACSTLCNLQLALISIANLEQHHPPHKRIYRRARAQRMHYIRLLRPLSLDDRGNIKVVLTVTTDLGDSFLSPPAPVPISVHLHDARTFPAASGPIRLTASGSQQPVWKPGMRVLKLDVRVPDNITRDIKKAVAENPVLDGNVDVCIMASAGLDEPLRAVDLPFDETKGHILGLSAPISLPGHEPKFLSKRRFSLASRRSFLELNEEIGESIDRHIWDGGVIAMGAICNMLSGLSTNAHHVTWDQTPLLKELLCSASGSKPVNFIELGCGVGILGLGLAAALDARLTNLASEGSVSMPSNILLTDLPDAEDLARTNISLCSNAAERSGRHPLVVLDFESLDWEDGKNGRFGCKVGRTTWDIIVISDCTYNVDMLPALVGTLSALSNKTTKDTDDVKHTKVMLATKPRHSSEKVLLDLMAQDGWEILETAQQRLRHLGKEDEVVEMYLFG